MGAVHTLQVSPFQAVGKAVGWSSRFFILVAIFLKING
jgi:hypothetical protein